MSFMSESLDSLLSKHAYFGQSHGLSGVKMRVCLSPDQILHKGKQTRMVENPRSS